jgi:CheY-like chemotaxis protein
MVQSQRQLKILIVDDSPAVVDILAQLCEFLGHEVFCAKDGAEGLILLHTEPDIDMVFTDYKMPKMDGAEMTKRIKARYQDLPVVLVTGSVVVTDSELKSAGFDAVVHKPFELKMIADSIACFYPQSGIDVDN